MSTNKNRIYTVVTTKVIRANTQREAVAFAAGDKKANATEVSSDTEAYRIYASELVDA